MSRPTEGGVDEAEGFCPSGTDYHFEPMLGVYGQ